MNTNIIPKIDRVLHEIKTTLDGLETVVDDMTTNAIILGRNANVLRASVADTTDVAGMYTALKTSTVILPITL